MPLKLLLSAACPLSHITRVSLHKTSITLPRGLRLLYPLFPVLGFFIYLYYWLYLVYLVWKTLRRPSAFDIITSGGLLDLTARAVLCPSLLA